MQTVGGAIITDIGGDDALGEPRIEPVEIGALVDKAAVARGRQESGAEVRHGRLV